MYTEKWTRPTKVKAVQRIQPGDTYTHKVSLILVFRISIIDSISRLIVLLIVFFLFLDTIKFTDSRA